MAKLTHKQERSCQDFVECGNKSEAYRRNYSTNNMTENTLNCEASKHFSNPKISQRVKELQNKLEEKHDIKKDKIFSELGNIAFFDIRTMFDENGEVLTPDKLSESAGKAISSVKVVERFNKDGDLTKTTEYKLNDKVSSIDKINRMLGNYEKDNKVELVGKVVTMLPPKNSDN